MRIRLEGSDLPGHGPDAHALRLRNVHVGVQRKAEVLDLVPADAVRAVWSFEVTSREVDGLLDVGGPWVHGRPGARFLYLSWGAVTSDGFAMFRRAKLMFGDVPTALLRAAHDDLGALVGRLPLTDPTGQPICARVPPSVLTWTIE